MAELEDPIGLIEKKRQGLGKPNIVYVKNFLNTAVISGSRTGGCDGEKVGDKVGDNPEGSNFLKFENQTSGSLKTKLQEVSKSNPNNNNMSKTDM